MTKRSALGILYILSLVAGFIVADGYYHHVEAQSAAETRAELDAGVAAPVVAVPPVAAEPVSTTTTISTTTTPAEADPVDSVRDVVEGARTGNWRLLAGGVLVLVMLGLKTIRDRTKWFAGDRGGAILVMLLSLAGALSTSLATGLPIDLRMLMGVVGVAFTAVGGYAWIKAIVTGKKAAA